MRKADRRQKRDRFHRARLRAKHPYAQRNKYQYSSSFEWKSRYSSTMQPDKFGRWARICYYRGFTIAWVDMVNDMFAVKEFWPTSSADMPLENPIFNSISAAKTWVEKGFKYFIQTHMTPQFESNILRQRVSELENEVKELNIELSVLLERNRIMRNTGDMWQFLLINALRNLTSEQQAGLCFDLYARSSLTESIDKKIRDLKRMNDNS